ncbi:hypothetical protein C475_14603 [Halosimplex carlsbadense 2-9-1]|uniref:Transcription factor TFIIB cyclin-like domain-containing protein n=1 Tax=Halosimplex carlsbadense 2-9-1 TaxID=797114 RepID=M0CMB4_9EURY|nr:transcription initiation factor IIB family protein [Halosimplex carlsbadense]ELZ23512.1 hypothetical protein C475_14603 [Halosimplex carlsbadense 2-9-1]
MTDRDASLATDGGLPLAHEQVDEIIDDLNLSDDVRETATEFAKRADYEHPINRAPSTIAASVVYYVALLKNEERSQKAVGYTADVSEVAIRECYQEIADLESDRVAEMQREAHREARWEKFMDLSEDGWDDPGQCWDHEDCPRDGCDGELQQQDRFNAMCLTCENAWGHVRDQTTHYLQNEDGEIVVEKPVAAADGGTEPDGGVDR